MVNRAKIDQLQNIHIPLISTTFILNFFDTV